MGMDCGQDTTPLDNIEHPEVDNSAPTDDVFSTALHDIISFR